MFLLACAGLVLLSGLFYLRPGGRDTAAEDDLADANLKWYRLRAAELAREGDAGELTDDARLRLLEDEQQQKQQPLPHTDHTSFPAWVLLPLIALIASAVYYQLGAASDVIITRQLDGISDATTEQEMAVLIEDLQARSAQRPDNLTYAALLGRYYMGQQDYTEAARTYETLLEAAPQDAQALAYAAQAEYLAGGRKLTPRARLRAEQALAANPQQRSALGLLGMASFERQEYRAAIAYWQRLLMLEQPGSESALILADVIQRAKEGLGEGPSAAVVAVDGVSQPAEPADVGAGVTVHVALPAGARANPADTVFVLARNAQTGSRMPIAVQRLTVAQLPITLRLDDSNSMAGQKLSEMASVIVAVQVSPDGRPGEANASWLGQIGPLAPTVKDAPLTILLQARDS